MRSWTSTITYSVFDMGRECETEEEYKEWVKQSFREEHNIELEDKEITDIEYEESEWWQLKLNTLIKTVFMYTLKI